VTDDVIAPATNDDESNNPFYEAESSSCTSAPEDRLSKFHPGTVSVTQNKPLTYVVSYRQRASLPQTRSLVVARMADRTAPVVKLTLTLILPGLRE